ncbi:MAG: hypothetical protein V9G19_03020 [Tetrasphaera sp.]
MIRTITVSAVAAGLAAGVAVAAPAQATMSESTPPGDHCVGNVDGRLLGCYATEAEADRAMSGARWIPLVKFYARTGYAGKTLRLGGAKACTVTLNDVNYAHPNLGVFGWNNRASSFVTRNHCDMVGYDGKSYRGDHFKRWVDHDIRLVRWNNDISSFALS